MQNERWMFLAFALVACGGAAAGDGTDGSDTGGETVDAQPTGDDGSDQPVTPPPADDPVEPVWHVDRVGARIKSPGQRMHFTEGLPFRILADGNDPRGWECPPGHPPYVCADSSMTFFVDGKAVGTVAPDPDNWDLWELRMPNGLPAGDHTLTVRFTPHAAPAVDGIVPIYIHVDPMPKHARTIDLSSDVVLTGATDLDWSDAVVNGHGHTVRAASGYAGKITIANSFVTGLAAFDNQVGLDVTTTGAVDITGSIFEATAPLRLVVNGNAPVTLRNNELRSTNYVTYVTSDPSRSPILELSGSTTGAKVMQGNNIGAGIVRISEMSGWQIGGLHDAESNIFVGPRCVLELDNAPGATIQGNYMHHDYYNLWSQGFNLQLMGSGANDLAEHNVIRDSSWPLQDFGGEFRYNLVINSGHDFVRGSQSGARYHHNLFVHAQAANTEFDGALLFTGSEQGISFDNNTLDVGGAVGEFDAPALVLSSGVTMASVRNNAFTQFLDVSGWSSKAIVAGAKGEGSVSSRVAKAGYNLFYNPLATSTAHYAPGIASGGHDIDADPRFTGDVPQAPCRIDEGAVWSRKYGVSQVLGYYRSLYTPAAGSPLVDAGDPADGAGTDIGAIGAGTPAAADKFGRVMTTN